MDNPALEYREIAKKIVAKLKVTMVEMIEQGKMPDLYWKLEQAIVDAMRHADTLGCDRTRQQMQAILTEFEDDDGTSAS